MARSARKGRCYTHTGQAFLVYVAPALAPGVVPTLDWWENRAYAAILPPAA